MKTDKRWSTTVDVTHLQAYVTPGMTTRFRLDNVLSNTYNVPIWSKVTLQTFLTRAKPAPMSAAAVVLAGHGAAAGKAPPPPAASPAAAPGAPTPIAANNISPMIAHGGTHVTNATSAGGGAAPAVPAAPAGSKAPTTSSSSSSSSSATTTTTTSGSSKGCRSEFVTAGADVPDQVIPLVQEGVVGGVPGDALAVLTGTGDT